MEENIKFILEALRKIKLQPFNKGEIECPKCKGKLMYTVSKRNGHIWGKCQTEDCLNWQQ